METTNEKITSVIYPAKPTKITEINKKYMEDYLKFEFEAGNITLAQGREFKQAEKEIKKNAKGGKSFTATRAAFVSKFFPELRNSKTNKGNKKESFGDFLDALFPDED